MIYISIINDQVTFLRVIDVSVTSSISHLISNRFKGSGAGHALLPRRITFIHFC
jgi:hypothetical protein